MKYLVLGASGFLGSHVARQLVEAGKDVRLFMRESSNSSATDDLSVERCYGDILDRNSLREAMMSCDIVYHCIVDTRAWLRDPTPLHRTNIDGLINVLDLAIELQVERFVYTSTIATIGTNPSGISTEEDTFNWWDSAPDYIRCRVQAEKIVLEYVRDKSLAAVICCVGNTYGANDIGKTPHGDMIKRAARGQMPLYWDGGGPCVGIVDAARAMVLAEENGVIGERYIIADKWLDYKTMFTITAATTNVTAPKLRIPIPLLYVIAGISEIVTRIKGKENRMNVASIKCSRKISNMSSNKARNELGWAPCPVEESVKQAALYYSGAFKQ